MMKMEEGRSMLRILKQLFKVDLKKTNIKPKGQSNHKT